MPIITITLRAPCNRSIAPPMPLTILPGITSWLWATGDRNLHRAKHCDIKVAAAMIPNEVDELKNAAPGKAW